MKLRTVASAATVALAALALLAGCKKGESNANASNANSKNTTVTANTSANTVPSPLGTPTSTAAASSPTEAFRLYYEAIKRRDAPAFKSLLSRGTIKILDDGAKKTNKSVDSFINEMFDQIGRDLPPTLPETRNEQINGDRATLEAHDVKKDKWETLHFINEGGWKLSMPGEGREAGNTGGDDDDNKDGGDDDHDGH
ncbi:MAG TPA: hypothetical protein VGC87_25515 [Pyrinomonadaceae bacterium]|jgi:hypothetical protein